MIVWKGALLSVNADKVPAADLLRQIAGVTGLQVDGLDKLRGQLSANFSELSLPDALDELLVGWDYAFTEGRANSGSPAKSHPRLIIFEISVKHAAPDVAPPAPSPAQPSSPQGSESRNPAGVNPRHGPLLAPGQKAPGVPADADTQGQDEEDKKISAVHAAAVRGDIKFLSDAVRDPDSNVQESAFEELVAIDKSAAVQALLDATQSDDISVAQQALELLEQTDIADDQTIIRALADALDRSDASIKIFAVQALARRGKDALDFLERALQDDDPSVRMSVVQSVAQQDWARALLEEARNDPDESIRKTAELLLQQSGPASPQEPQQQEESQQNN